METTINVSELTLVKVNARLFFNYLAIKLNNLDNAKELEIGDFFDLLKNIKKGKYKNILADFSIDWQASKIVNFCYYLYTYTKYNNLALIYDFEKILINVKFRGSIISLIINNFSENYKVFEFFNDFLDYEADALNND